MYDYLSKLLGELTFSRLFHTKWRKSELYGLDPLLGQGARILQNSDFSLLLVTCQDQPRDVSISL